MGRSGKEEMRRGTIRRNYLTAVLLFVLFAIFTLIVKNIDVEAIGPQGSTVGLARFNRLVLDTVKADPNWDRITDLLALVSAAFGAGFMFLALKQVLRRRSLWKVDFGLVLLAAHFVLMCAAYILFEMVIINYRPVLTEEGLEASYPSSHTMFVLCIMIPAVILFHRYLRRHIFLLVLVDILCIALIAQAPVGRIMAGMHWATDVIGACILSAALCMLYYAVLFHYEEEH